MEGKHTAKLKPDFNCFHSEEKPDMKLLQLNIKADPLTTMSDEPQDTRWLSKEEKPNIQTAFWFPKVKNEIDAAILANVKSGVEDQGRTSLKNEELLLREKVNFDVYVEHEEGWLREEDGEPSKTELKTGSYVEQILTGSFNFDVYVKHEKGRLREVDGEPSKNESKTGSFVEQILTGSFPLSSDRTKLCVASKLPSSTNTTKQAGNNKEFSPLQMNEPSIHSKLEVNCMSGTVGLVGCLNFNVYFQLQGYIRDGAWDN
ncbi:hypothetical protein ElyMa_005512100 [Elysia marginata]|uniref:Uncharacterized protein n=1 Tax=Elysia marginata TaxID=1093978 RepID=A0AAV4EUD0_9GAST|nr:hypothetical protein ElyMa_005512100 [Elysia marginata]